MLGENKIRLLESVWQAQDLSMTLLENHEPLAPTSEVVPKIVIQRTWPSIIIYVKGMIMPMDKLPLDN